MAKFPVEVVARDQALVGYNDRITSSTLNKKFAGWPKGVYVGFIPSTTPGNPVLTFNIDPVESFSMFKVPSNLDIGGMDVVSTTPIALDFTGHAVFPVLVIGRVSYDATAPTIGEIITIIPRAVNDNEVLLCQVSGSSLALSINATAPTYRDTPLAFAGVNFGFMPAGSIEALELAADAVAEVVAARTGLDAVVYQSLSQRIAADYGASNMAQRLSLLFQGLRSNVHTVTSPTGALTSSTVNVSGSFSSVNRDNPPQITLSGTGSETVQGVISGPSDTIRNVCVVVSSTTGSRLINNETDRRVIYGRLVGPTIIGVAGTLTFTTAQIDVTGVGSKFLSDIQLGDTLLGPDGNYYEVQTVTSDTSLVLRNAYVGVTPNIAASSVRRFLLNLRTLVSGVETTTLLSTGTSVRFTCPAFMRRNLNIADNTLIGLAPGARPAFPSATTATAGKVQLATTGSLVGAVFVKNQGTLVAGGPFHSINFANGTASQTPGRAAITKVGNTGPTGIPGLASGPGPDGDTGPGFTFKNFTPFKKSAEFNLSGIGPVVMSFTAPMGHTIRYITGGFARIRDFGFWAIPNDSIEITDISFAADSGTIDFSAGFPGAATDLAAKLYLSSAGDPP